MGDDAAPDKPLTKRARRTEEMRRRILDASLRLFIQQGYEKTTTRQILNEVGILNGSLYNIYSSKEEIFSDIVMMALEDAIRQTAPGPPPRGRTRTSRPRTSRPIMRTGSGRDRRRHP